MVTHTHAHTSLTLCCLENCTSPCRPAAVRVWQSAWGREHGQTRLFQALVVFSNAKLWESEGTGCVIDSRFMCVCVCVCVFVCSAWLMRHPFRVLSLSLCVHNPNPWPTSISYAKSMRDTHTRTHTHTQLSHAECDAMLLLFLHDMSSDIAVFAFAFQFFNGFVFLKRSFRL